MRVLASLRSWDTWVVHAELVLDVMCRRGCRFVVVGSVARALTGDSVNPKDLDIVVDASPAHRPALVEALIDLGSEVECRRGRVPVTRSIALPWRWGWRSSTPLGDIDVITRFIDDTTIEEHDELASTVVLSSGNSVRCHPTRWRP